MPLNNSVTFKVLTLADKLFPVSIFTVTSTATLPRVAIPLHLERSIYQSHINRGSDLSQLSVR